MAQEQGWRSWLSGGLLQSCPLVVWTLPMAWHTCSTLCAQQAQEMHPGRFSQLPPQAGNSPTARATDDCGSSFLLFADIFNLKSLLISSVEEGLVDTVGGG